MTIKQFYPPIETRRIPPYVQCGARASDMNSPRGEHWRKHRYADRGLDYTRCSRNAQYEIDDKPYCSAHAAKLALKRWIDGSLVERKEGKKTVA